MSGKVFSGKDGRLYVKGNPVGKVVDWSFEGQNETLETTSLADTSRTYVYGIRGYTGSATLLYYKEDSKFNIKPLFDAAKDASGDISIKLQVADSDGTADAPRSIEMNILVTSYSTGINVGEVMKMQFSFTANGTPTFNLAPA